MQLEKKQLFRNIWQKLRRNFFIEPRKHDDIFNFVKSATKFQENLSELSENFGSRESQGISWNKSNCFQKARGILSYCSEQFRTTLKKPEKVCRRI